MRASEFVFQQMMDACKKFPNLGIAASYIQVEYGLSELRACWDGFVDASDEYGKNYRNRNHVCLQFADELRDYLEHLGEPIPDEMGQEIY